MDEINQNYSYSRSYFYDLVKVGRLAAHAVKGKKRGFWVLERDVLKLVNRKILAK